MVIHEEFKAWEVVEKQWNTGLAETGAHAATGYS